MKTALVLLFLALFAAVYAVQACDPDGDGMPDCTGTPVLRSRNFFDPTHYWECDTGVAVSVACPAETGFDPKIGYCVSWDIWQWYEPCTPIEQ